MKRIIKVLFIACLAIGVPSADQFAWGDEEHYQEYRE